VFARLCPPVLSLKSIPTAYGVVVEGLYLFCFGGGRLRRAYLRKVKPVYPRKATYSELQVCNGMGHLKAKRAPHL